MSIKFGFWTGCGSKNTYKYTKSGSKDNFFAIFRGLYQNKHEQNRATSWTLN